MILKKETKIRILSAIILLLISMLIFSLGKKAIMLTIFLLIAVVFDEILKYFFKHTRDDYAYWLYMTIFVFMSVVLYQIKNLNFTFWSSTVLYASMLCQAILLIGMLFRISWEKEIIFLNPFFWSTNLSLTFLSFVILLNQEFWFEMLIFFVAISIVADSMAWVVGKKFGKRKLYPEVSPNKTLEGAIGGWIFSGIMILCYYLYVSPKYDFMGEVAACVVFLPILSIMGDLTQSYFKRMVHLKDSSQRIPGHGGFYDRLDSHLFLIPFFLFFTKMISNW